MFWGLKLEPGRWTPYVPPPDVHLRARVTRATLRETCEDGTRVTVKMRCETDEAVLAGALGTKGEREEDEDDEEDVFEEFGACALVGGRVESCGMDLVLDEYVEFTVDGDVGVDLTGYYEPDVMEEMMEDEEAWDDDAGTYGEDDSEDDSSEDDSEDDSEDEMMMGDDSDDEDSDDEDSDSEDDSDDEDSDSEDEDDSEDEGVTRKGGVQIQEIEAKKPAQKRPAESKPAKTPEPKKQAVAKEAPKKPDTPKRVHKNGMEIINTHATKNAKAKVATGGKKVAMKYIGKLPSGKIFDQTKGKASFTFRLGVGEVIRGWDVGVEGMREGDKRTLIIPAAMGYGKKGIKGVIPGGSALHFDVELVKVF